jgi:hypothetical protein
MRAEKQEVRMLLRLLFPIIVMGLLLAGVAALAVS